MTASRARTSAKNYTANFVIITITITGQRRFGNIGETHILWLLVDSVSDVWIFEKVVARHLCVDR